MDNTMQTSESIANIAAALCKFQGAVDIVRKTETNPFFHSKYASLSNIIETIQAPLVENGLSFVQFPVGEHGLETMLMHTSGEWIRGSYKMTPSKNDPQGIGSAITYQRRYALGAVLGLNIDDDDGNAASRKPKASTKPAIDPYMAALSAIKSAKTPAEKEALREKINKGTKLSKNQKDSLLNSIK